MSHFADDETLAHIAALELEVVRLREALEHLSKAAGQTIDVRTPEDWVNLNIGLSLSIQALSTPFTPTVLNELIEKVEKRTIDRALKMLKSKHSHEVAGATHHAGNWHAAYDYHMTRQAVLSETLDAIRALPNVTLEELL